MTEGSGGGQGGNMLELYRMLGNIQGDLRSINDKLDKAETGRAKVHERMDGIGDKVTALTTGFQTMQKEVSDAKAVTEDVKRWKLIGMGALAVVGLGGTALGAAIVSALEPVARLFHR
jgi:hypothetical protein